MKCPIDDSVLVMTERTGIEIDYCPTCRGVWLDRGELDKIIDRSLTPGGAQPQQPPAYRDGPKSRHGDREHGSNNPGYGQQPRRRESWLSNLFD